MAANGNLIFQDTNKATFVGANSNVVIDTVNASFGVGVDVNGPTSNLHVVGNAYVTSNMEVGTANLFVDTVNSRVGINNASPVKDLHIKTSSNGIVAGLDQVTTYNGLSVGLGFGLTDTSQSNRIFKGGIFFKRSGGATGRGDLLFCIENTEDNTTEVSPANEYMKIDRQGRVDIPTLHTSSSTTTGTLTVGGGVGIVENLNVGGNFTVDTDTLYVDAANDRVGIGTTSVGSGFKLQVDGIIKAQAVNCSGSGPVITCAASNPGDMISKRYASADRYGMGQYAGGITRLFTSTAYSAGRICFSGATDDVTGSAAAFTDYVTIDNSGNVGVGVTDPDGTLHVKADNRVHITEGTTPAFTGLQGANEGRSQLVLSSYYSDLVIASSRVNNAHGSTLSFTTVNPSNTADYRKFVINQGNWGSRKHMLDFGYEDSSVTNPHIAINSTDTVLTLDGLNKRVGIGATSPGGRFTLQMGTGNVTGGSGMRFIQQSGTNYWDLGTSTSTDPNFVFSYLGGSKGYLLHTAGNSQLNFTGQHRTFIKDTPFTEAENLEGLIVSADQNKYIKMSGGIEAGSNAITTNESLPLVSLSTTGNDKKCFGVISTSEDPEKRSDTFGSFVTPYEKEKGDTRVYINSVGEGAIWVTDINGSLESGDYITTSNVTGYGQRQESEFLANYTVAKITMDCEFEPVTQPIQQIKKEMGDVNYWVNTTYDNVSEEEYSNLTEENRRLVDDIYQKITNEVSKTEQEGWELEVRRELVNVLDEHGQIQWEDDPSGATEKAYKIRYLDADGNITDEANHVHKAAFVGCTYHCG